MKAVFAFIDSQNLNLGVRDEGWKLDFKKFRRYLNDKFRVKKAFLFIGYIAKNRKLYSRLKSYGYILIFKPTVQNTQGKPKGNVDAELVLYSAAIEYPHYDQAVIVSGDGDFYCLHEYLVKNDKLLAVIIPNRRSESSLLKRFQKFKIFLVRDRDKIEKKI